MPRRLLSMRVAISLLGAFLVAVACSSDDEPGATDSPSKGGAPGAGGDSGEGGASTAEDCNDDPLNVDLGVIRGCVMQAGCNPFLPTTSLSFCVTNQRLRAFPQDDCGTGATSCDEFLECLGVGYHDAGDCSSGERALCEGSSLAVTCARYAYAVDCTARGGECGTYEDDDGLLTARCFHAELDGCNDPPDESRCAGDVAYSCVDGVAYGSDCAASDSQCRDGACLYPLPSCSEPGARCGTGTRLDLCYEGGELARYDCAPGLRCEAPSGGPVACVAPGCATDERCDESCDGTELTLCYGGVPFTLDCADYGFSSCLETTSGGTRVAHCARPVTARDRACDVLDSDSACGSCAKRACCPSWTTCVDNSDCVRYIGCATECDGDAECIADCRAEYPRGATVWTAFADCRELNCEC